MRKFMLIPIMGLLFLALRHPGITKHEYIQMYKDIAMQEMIRVGIPASITLAQGILESGFGNSRLTTKANNHFGIKCHNGWEGGRIYEDDDELNECFRKYDDAEQSFFDHSTFLASSSRYAYLFELEITDYKGWAEGLKKAGYATNPKYGKMLIELIKNDQLYKYDSIALSKQDDFVFIPESEIFECNRVNTILTKKGDSPSRIAERYDISVDKLLKYNDLSDNALSDEAELEPKQKFFLQAKRSSSFQKFIWVPEHVSMYQISQDFGIKLTSLYKRNLMTMPQQPMAGQKLMLRGKRKTRPIIRPILIETMIASPYIDYTVKQGDSLYRIARNFETSVQKIMDDNNLRKPEIKPGNVLRIYGY